MAVNRSGKLTRETPEFERRAFVYSSANASAARELGRHTESVIEVRGLDEDFDAILKAVKRANRDPKRFRVNPRVLL